MTTDELDLSLITCTGRTSLAHGSNMTVSEGFEGAQLMEAHGMCICKLCGYEKS